MTDTSPTSTLDLLRTIKDFEQLAEFLGVSQTHLRFVLYDPKYQRYKTFEIPKRKKGETRTISMPSRALDQLQQCLLAAFQDIYHPRESVYGFTQGRSIVTNAEYHRKGRRIRNLLNIDLKDFFPSIHLGRIRGMLAAEPYKLDLKVATWIAQIVSTYSGLPQGACTSPILSNMLCSRLDTQLSRLSRKHHCRYTRYADDLVFSATGAKFPPELAYIDPITNKIMLGEELIQIITRDKDEENFRINTSKIKFQTPQQRQEVTGLVVNEFVNVPRQFIREVRAMLHDWERNGLLKATANHLLKRKKHRSPNKGRLDFRSVVRGKIEFIGMVRGKDDRIYRRLFIKYSRLTGTPATSLYDASAKPDVFISYKREDREKAVELHRQLSEYGFNVWIDHRIRGGADWKKTIFNAIAQTACFIALISTPYRERLSDKKSIIRQEVEAALKRTKPGSDEICLIPVRLDAKDYPKLLSHLHGYTLPDGLASLSHTIDEHLKLVKEKA